MSPKPRSGGARNSAPCWPTRKSSTARAKSAAFRSSASRCANGCCASPPTPSDCWQDLDTIDWSDSLKEMQRNWIGRSEGAEVDFPIAECGVRNAECQKGIRVFTTRPDTLFGATYMVLAPEHKLVDEITTPEQRAGGRGLPGRGRQKERSWNAPNWPRKKPASSPALTPSIPSTARRFPSGLPTTCSPATAPAPSWRCRRMTRATSNSPQSSICPLFRSSSRPTGKRIGTASSDDGIAVNSRISSQRPAHARSQEENHRLAGRKGSRQEDHQLQTARLAVQPPALLGRAVSDRLEEGRRRAASITRPCRNRALPLLPPPLDDYKPTRRRRAAAGPRQGLGESARRLDARNQHHAPMGRQLLVLPPLSRSRNEQRLLRQGRRALLDGHAAPRSTLHAPRTTPGVDLYVGGTEHAVLHLLYARFWHKVCSTSAMFPRRSRSSSSSIRA